MNKFLFNRLCIWLFLCETVNVFISILLVKTSTPLIELFLDMITLMNLLVSFGIRHVCTGQATDRERERERRGCKAANLSILMIPLDASVFSSPWWPLTIAECRGDRSSHQLHNLYTYSLISLKVMCTCYLVSFLLLLFNSRCELRVLV